MRDQKYYHRSAIFWPIYDLARLLAEYNNIEYNSIKLYFGSGPWLLVYPENHYGHSEAMHREDWLKSGVVLQLKTVVLSLKMGCEAS